MTPEARKSLYEEIEALRHIEERERAHALNIAIFQHRSKDKRNMLDRFIGEASRLSILVERVGDIARTMIDCQNVEGITAADGQRLIREELIKTSVALIAWIETLSDAGNLDGAMRSDV